MSKFKITLPSLIKKIGIPLFKKRDDLFEYHERDRYLMGHHWGGDTFGDRDVEDFRRGMIDQGGRERKVKPIKGMLTSNMLTPNGKGGYVLASRFRKFYSGFRKKDLENEIELLEAELRRRR